jgi:hypothetical protein
MVQTITLVGIDSVRDVGNMDTSSSDRLEILLLEECLADSVYLLIVVLLKVVPCGIVVL